MILNLKNQIPRIMKYYYNNAEINLLNVESDELGLVATIEYKCGRKDEVPYNSLKAR